MVTFRPAWLKPADPFASQCGATDLGNPGFVCHPSTSELASRLMVDPESLSNENYSGIYDQNGDYVPQFCDDPEKLPRSHSMTPNQETPSQPVESSAGTEGQNGEKPGTPANTEPGTSD